jgi:hypothetical protein
MKQNGVGKDNEEEQDKRKDKNNRGRVRECGRQTEEDADQFKRHTRKIRI